MLALMVMLILLVWATWSTWPSPETQRLPSRDRDAADLSGVVARPSIAEVLVLGSPAARVARVRSSARCDGRPVLTEDDLIAFGLALEASDDILSELVGRSPSGAELDRHGAR
jgi:hypothetical protein